MAVPLYATDLTDYDLAENDAAWTEFTGRAGGASPDEDDTDNEIQGTMMCSQATNTDTEFVSQGTDLGGEIALAAGEVFLVWQQHTSPGAIATYANDGMQILIGADFANYEGWTVGGSDVFPNPYGGWQNNPVDPTLSVDSTYGSPGVHACIGSSMYMVSAVFKGQPHQVDAIRYGRAEARISGGESANYATFQGFATVNDYNDAGNGYNRWGLLQATMGGFLWKGLFTIGYGAACDFRDTNKTIFVQDTRKVLSSFNKIEIGYASTNVEWNGISIICVAPLTTASKGELEVITDVVVTMDGCTFIDLNTLIFQSNSTLTNTTFRRCGQVTQGSGTFDGCVFEESTAASSLLVDDLDLIDNCDFTSDGSNHAIQLNDAHAGGDFSIEGCTFTDYAAVSGSTGNECIYNNAGSGLVTIYIVGGDYPTIRNGINATTKLIQATTYTLTGLVSGSEVNFVETDTGITLYHVEIATEDDGTGNDTKKVIYSYNYASDTPINIYIHKIEYVWMNVSDTLTDTNKITPVAQQSDRWYSNP